MEDPEPVCPLCCEEVDISDREFYPCKCGYQVCMWCWHRIRESESGLCPACRTPYGEDPHQFTAVDVEDLLQQQQQSGTNSHHGNSHHHHSSSSTGSSSKTKIPKDRSSLANMRVIRRNLVYAVGLPPMSEDTLRKADYFGQYGKIHKIVLNRGNTTEPPPPAPRSSGSNSRLPSASAYVTFYHKEDTLACILALDGFYWENRNIRASYGTSKYCSAFIKSVRCNNPECTYLHEMGEPEDTFTKQEIQAGYVTSGRDVLARQQQIVQEQLQQQQQQLGVTSTQAAMRVRKKVGGGGPSGTGKPSTNPVFPPPEYDEPPKPAPVRATRAVSQPSLHPATIAAKLGRASSVGTAPFAGKSAASIVAGVHTTRSAHALEKTTLTPLTPLKRTTVKPKPPTAPPEEHKQRLLAEQQHLAKRATTSIGGEVIAPVVVPPMPRMTSAAATTTTASSVLGGEIFTGTPQLQNRQPIGRVDDGIEGEPLPGFNASWTVHSHVGSSLIGGVPIGMPPPDSNTNHSNGNNNNKPSDIALLQSLLPGVHITSGNDNWQSGWGAIGPARKNNNNDSSSNEQKHGGIW